MTSEYAYHMLMEPIVRYENRLLFNLVPSIEDAIDEEDMDGYESHRRQFTDEDGSCDIIGLVDDEEYPIDFGTREFSEEGVVIDIPSERVATHVRQILDDPDPYEGAFFAYKLLSGALMPHQVYCQHRVDLERKIEVAVRMWSELIG